MEINETILVVREAMKRVSKDVRAPKCVRDGIVKMPKKKKINSNDNKRF